ncbi:MAG TPA: porin family protein [Chitinophagaceae bacterium]|nr:porin family protein [Chitinophagaceae bacterium]
MQTIKFRNIIHLSFNQVILTSVFIICSFVSFAQDEKMNNAEHDDKPYYFGITLGMNAAQYKVSQSNYFIDNDTIKDITPLWKPGFQLGIMGNLKLSNFIDIRLIPTFVLREKALQFTLREDSTQLSSFESILFSLPFEFKFKSDRQTNFRFYVCAGGKLDYDFNANTRSKRIDEIIKVKPIDFGYNLGLGFEFYFPNFIFAPEIKVSNGLGNILDRNSDEPTNKAIDRLTTRMLIISFHIEG